MSSGAVVALLAFALRAPIPLVQAVYDFSGLDGVCVVEYESRFHPNALRKEPHGTSYGLFQLYDKYHQQHRDDLMAHIATGAAFWEACMERTHRDVARAYSLYNSGSSWKSIKKGFAVQHRRDSLALYLWRRMR